MSEYALEVRGLTKRFGEVVANDGINLSVQPRTIHAIVGENGAGKTTLMRCLFGLCQPDSGELWLWGQPVRLPSPLEALRQGVGMVHQHFMLVEALRVWENVVLGAEQGHGLMLAVSANRDAVRQVSSRYGLEVDADAVVGNLPVGIQQRVEILKVLYRGARLIILDEPTAVLTPQETQRLFEVMRALKADGCTILFITHKLAEVIAVADEVTVMRNGRSVGTWPIAETTEKMLAHEMVGRDVNLQSGREPAGLGRPVLELEAVSVEGVLGDEALRSVSFTLHEGEILGVAGVAGNGQEALVEGILGLRRVTSGTIRLRGEEINGISVHRIRAKGVGCIPSDRLKMGLVAELSLVENSLLGFDGLAELRAGPFFRPSKVRERALAVADEFHVKADSLDGAVGQLSGGNQQKFILGRELHEQPRLIIAVQPTRGVDIGAIEFIQAVLLKRRNEGAAVLLISNEMDEIMDLSDTIIVLFRGQVSGSGRADRLTRDEIGLMMAGAGGVAR